MKNEFKLIASNKTHTRYVLENASSGGTSSGSIASISGALGGVRKRDNILAQETNKPKSVPASTPRNFVAKHAKTSGAGQHSDKKRAQKQGQTKHKQSFMEDHEIQMASSELMSIVKNSQNLLKLVQRYSEQQGLDAWQQSKITKAADYLNSVLQSISGEQSTVEGYSVVPGIDSERYQSRPGLEGPFHAKNGKVVYYDPREGKYYDPDSDYYISHDDWQSMNEDDRALQAYLSKGGEIKQLPYKKPRVADKTNYGSKHIGGSGDKKKLSRTGLAARTTGSKVVGIPESPELNELDISTMQNYRAKRKESPAPTSLRQGVRQSQGMRNAAEKIHAKKTDAALRAKGDPRMASDGVAEGAKVDRQAAHITQSMMKKGKTKKQAQGIAWAHIKHPKDTNEGKDSYMESLTARLNKKLK